MYAWIWHRLPGARPVKIVEAVLLAAAVLALLWFVVFPLLGPLLPFDDVTVD
ncbi:hypothetical protein [Actinomadura rugatobispora]|uniref:Uncharacterized protein n=1 Tax=Actinomadura rugatobispora TaxID=1994 RepID=A0ABW1A9W0_9ACTN|nr:hypothetical protein GCM10010200_066620 [Actinomadura rugatobispora]